VIAVNNLNNVIDRTTYPVEETKRSNLRHRPIGIGVQGLADAYLKMKYPFESDRSRQLNKKIFETMYYAALSQSSKLCRKEYTKLVRECKERGEIFVRTYSPDDYDDHLTRYTNPSEIPTYVHAYPSITWKGGAPIFREETLSGPPGGLPVIAQETKRRCTFHWELAGLKPEDLCGAYDWETLREHIETYGVRNSTLLALMPTASTSQFLGNNEAIEPFTTNIYKRKTLAGEFIVINKYLIHDMFRLGLWNVNIKEYLLVLKGSIQAIEGIPDELKQLYRTAYEIDTAELINQAADRQPFVDQAQSLNWFMSGLDLNKFTKLAFLAWKLGLKTGKYYLHSESAVESQKFTVDPEKQKEIMEMLEREKSRRDTSFLDKKKEDCIVCSA
jgi:ribonucleotide reductase alpha subunit